jgi:hypothetical protein
MRSVPKKIAKQSLLSSRRMHLQFDEFFASIRTRSSKPLLFNIDLHISVMRDLNQELIKQKIDSIRWSISGSNRFVRPLYKISDPVEVLNSDTWAGLDSDLISRFEERYSTFLRKFDGFVVTHTPAFSQLYRSFDKPILVINSTRYEAPYTANPVSWNELDSYLVDSVAKKKMLLVSNNRGDADYLKFKTGISSDTVPSFCDYTKLKWVPGGKHKVIVSRSLEVEQLIEDVTGGEWIGIRRALGENYTWKQFLDVKEVFYVPYNISTMSLFELATAGVPVKVPSRNLLKKMASIYSGVLSELSYFQIRALDTEGLSIGDPNNYSSDLFHDWWLDRADFYDSKLMPNVQVIDEIEALKGGNLVRLNDSRLNEAQLVMRNNALKESRSWLVEKFATML